MDATTLARAIDHTLLRPEATETAIHRLCEEAVTHRFAAVCINPTWVKLAARLLRDQPPDAQRVAVCSVVGFPLGATPSLVKAAEAALAVDHGAGEVDMVINLGLLLDDRYQAVAHDIAAVRGAIGPARARQLNLAGYACMGVSMALFIVIGMRGGAG